MTPTERPTPDGPTAAGHNRFCSELPSEVVGSRQYMNRHFLYVVHMMKGAIP
jgi:hypothetical protein